MPNWTIEVFKIVKVHCTNPVTYLLEDYRGKSVAGAFYEYELHRATYSDVYLVKKILRRKSDKVYEVAGIRWITQFLDTQGQCDLIYTVFP